MTHPVTLDALLERMEYAPHDGSPDGTLRIAWLRGIWSGTMANGFPGFVSPGWVDRQFWSTIPDEAFDLSRDYYLESENPFRREYLGEWST